MPNRTHTSGSDLSSKSSEFAHISAQSPEGRSDSSSLADKIDEIALPEDNSPVDIEMKTAEVQARMKTVVAQVKEHTKIIVSKTEAKGSGLGYLINSETAPELDPSSKDFPAITNTIVKVVPHDTYDAAIETSNGIHKSQTSDFMPVCVLNFANSHRAGGGWEKGSFAQEEQLFYRSTISATLHEKFYPMGTFEGIYSPHVIIFRENLATDFKFMAMLNSPESLPTVSVISMAAETKSKRAG